MEDIYLFQQAVAPATGFSQRDRLVVPNSAVNLPPNISFSIRATGNTFGYGFFARPTPGGPNQGWFSGPELALPVIEDADSLATAPSLLKGRVFRSGTFRARLTHPESGTALLYTLNGEDPTSQSAVYKEGKPIVITGTTILQVKAMKTGRLPSRIVTRSFIHTPKVLAQRLPGVTGTPTRLVCNPAITTAYGDTGTVPAALAGHSAAGRLPEQLEARPTVSIASPAGRTPDDISDPSGIPVSLEYIDPANPGAYFQQNAGMTQSGNHPGTTNWSLRFRKAFTLDGKSGFQGPVLTPRGNSAVFPESPVTSFTRLLLRGGSGNSWQNKNTSALYFSDSYLKELSRSFGTLTAHRRWVHLYLNGVYWGMCDLQEFMDADWISAHLKAQNPSVAPETLEADDILFYRES